MSDLNKQDNPTIHGAQIVPTEKEIEIPPKKYTIGIGPVDVENNLMRLTGVEKYSFKEINGKIYRIGKNGVEYPPVTKEQYEEIKKAHEEYFGKQTQKSR